MRVLSIQSHVVHGYVGNKSATFPLQLLGFDVDPLNAVQFSNHTGERLEGPQIQNLLSGLERNGLFGEYTHLLTGYLGRESSLHVIADVAKKLKNSNANFTFVLDPVMGDEQKLYVPQELIPIYRDILCPLADVITPNAFEVELLTGVTVRDLDTARKALIKLHNLGPKTVIITSADLLDCQESSDIIPNNSPDSSKPTLPFLHMLASERTLDGIDSRFSIRFNRLAHSFTGTGDVFAALILANMHIARNEYAKAAHTNHNQSSDTPSPLRVACQRAVNSMQGILIETITKFQEQTSLVDPTKAPLDRAALMRCRELALVRSRKWIENPPQTLLPTDI